MKLQQSMGALITASGLMLALSAPRTVATTRYVWQESPSPTPPYTNWSTAAHVIQEAVDAAQAGETVLVTNGVYRAGTVSLTSQIELRSVNGSGVTILDGQGSPCAYLGNGSVLSGFTVTNGFSFFGEGWGGGVWCESSGVVSNSVLTGNTARSGAGGAYGGTLYNCTLTGNSALYGGGGGAYGSTLYNCVLTGNTAGESGGGGAAGCTVSNCTLTDNSAHFGGGASDSTLYNCQLSRNSANDGSGAYGGTLYNCVLTGNSGWGASRAILYNCTLTGNSGGWCGGAIESTLYNCIVYHNTAGDGRNHSRSTFFYSCTTPLPAGEGNIEADPQLASVDHLSSSSPCLAAGSAVYASGVDIDGELWANPPCIGADQLTPASATGPLALQIQAYTHVAIGYPVSLTALNTGPILQSVWNFGDGTMLTNRPFASHTWSERGIYTVRLTGYNDSFPGGITTSLTMTVSDGVSYVSQMSSNPVPPFTSWETAATTIQDAIRAAAPSGVVLVTNGVYDVGGGVNESRVALSNSVVLRSVNGPGVTQIVGGEFRCVYLGSDAILSGFTLTNGHAEYGGGVWCEASGVVTNCVITSNSAKYLGGGAYGGALRNCTLSHNLADGSGGGAFYGTLHNCTLTGNSANDGGGAIQSTLYNCTLTGNSGGGATGGSLYNCVLTGNSGWCAARAFLYNCALTGNSGSGAYGSTLRNCVVTGNSGLAAFESILYNCTLTGNSGGGTSGGSLYNCVVYHNTAGNGLNHSGSTFFYSCTTPLPPGAGNIDADPQLVSFTHLSVSSPCIGAGSAAYSSGVDTDGEPWLNPPCIGADQLTPGSATGLLALQIQASDMHVKTGYAASFTGLIDGRTLQSVWDFGDGTRLTNRLFASHAWSERGAYTVRLTGYNDSFPDGITASLTMMVSDGVSYVNQANSNPLPPYTSWETAATDIQSAISAAAIGGVVLVTNGVYASGHLAWADIGASRVAINRALRVQSVSGPDVTVIRGDDITRCVFVGSNAILSGFTLTNGHAASGGGLWCEVSGVVSNCVLTGNSAQGNGGGAIGGTLYNSTLNGNSAAGDGGGAFDSTLYNCTVILNSAQGAGGGVGGGSQLYNCIVYYNTARTRANHADSTFEYSCTTPLPPGEGSIDADPQLASATHLSASSPCIGAGSATNTSGVDIDGEPWADPPCIGADQFTFGNAQGPIIVSIEAAFTNAAVGFAIPFTGVTQGRLTASMWDFGDGTVISNRPLTSHAWTAPGGYTVTLRGFNDSYPEGVSSAVQVTVLEQPVHYVNKANSMPVFPYASWQTAAANIQDAVDAAPPGSLVLVTNGVYDVGGGVNGSRVDLLNPIVLRSVNGPEPTVIAGDGMRCVYVGVNTTLSGFTLTNGGWAYEGGGVWCESSGVVSNCVLTANYARLGGGAFGGILYNCVLTGNSIGGKGGGRGGGAFAATLYDCVLTVNSADGYGGGAFESTLHNCTLSGNSAWNGGGAGDSRLYNCTLTGNSGDGADGSTLYNCVLTGNAGHGASGATLYNCTLTGNSGNGTDGSTLYNCVLTGNSGWGASGSTLHNCTLTVNSGGGVTGATLFNCIVYHNTATESPNHLESTFEYSCTTPLPTNGVGNIDADPQLASTTHLSGTSPCIGAGSAAYASGVDIDGELWAEPPCMGADQFVAGNAVGPIEVSIKATYTNVTVGFALSFIGSLEGRLSRSVWEFEDRTLISNRLAVTHTWNSVGIYSVRLTGYNDSHPEGISAVIIVTVSDGISYVNQAGSNPVPPYRSWDTAANNIQDAIDFAAAYGVVWVTNGVYQTGHINTAGSNRVAINKPLRVQSVNGPGVTLIEGAPAPDGGGGDGAIRCVYVGAGAALSGFTLTNGHAEWGGGAYCETSGTVSNCDLVGNSAGGGGGVIGGVLYHCILRDNAAGDGGGAYSSTLLECRIFRNGAGWGGGTKSSALANCILSDNSAGFGGGSWISSLHNCILVRNSAKFFGGGALGGEMYHCTFARNSAQESGGGFSQAVQSPGTLYNCIVSSNAAPTGPNFDGGTFTYSCTTPLPSGDGNVNVDPAFVNLEAGDFRLRADSPCIDAGTDLSAILTTDLAGLPRPLDGNGDGLAKFDMGAYEFNPYHFMPTLQFSTNGFQFTVRGEPGRSVRIERSRDLVHWEFAGQVPIPASGQGVMHDLAAQSEPQLFYRAVSVP